MDRPFRVDFTPNDFLAVTLLNKYCRNINLADLIAVLGSIDFVLGSVDLAANSPILFVAHLIISPRHKNTLLRYDYLQLYESSMLFKLMFRITSFLFLLSLVILFDGTILALSRMEKGKVRKISHFHIVIAFKMKRSKKSYKRLMPYLVYWKWLGSERDIERNLFYVLSKRQL